MAPPLEGESGLINTTYHTLPNPFSPMEDFGGEKVYVYVGIKLISITHQKLLTTA